MSTLDVTLRYLQVSAAGGAATGGASAAGRLGLDATVVGTLARKLAVDEPFLLRLASIRARTYQRRKSDKAPLTETESDRVLRVARIAQEAERVFGGPDKATRWLSRPSAALGGVAPLALLGSDAGARDVEAELTRIEWGDLA